MPKQGLNGISLIQQSITHDPSTARITQEAIAAGATTVGTGKLVAARVPQKKRRRHEPPSAQPLRTQPKRGQPSRPTTEDTINGDAASTDPRPDAPSSRVLWPPESKRVRLMSASERVIDLDDVSTNPDAGLSTSVYSIGFEYENIKETVEANAGQPSKERPDRVLKPALMAETNPDNETKPALVENADRITLSSDPPVHHFQSPPVAAPSESTTVANIQASAHVAPIAWRGGLNRPLAMIMSQEYDRTLTPVPGVGKMAIYREWGIKLGIGGVDRDGSRVRKAVCRVSKEFEKACALLESGNSDQTMLLEICPEFEILFPVFRPNDRKASISNSKSAEPQSQGSGDGTRIPKRKREEKPKHRPSDVPEYTGNQYQIEAAEINQASPARKRARNARDSTRHGSLERSPSPTRGEITTEAACTQKVEHPRFADQNDYEEQLLAEHAAAVGDASIIRQADLLIAIMAEAFCSPLSQHERPENHRAHGTAAVKVKSKRHVGRGNRSRKET
jgi:hypothetical protein